MTHEAKILIYVWGIFMKRKSLKTKFIVYFLFVILGIVLVVGGVSYKITYDSLSKEAEEKLNLAIEKLSKEVDSSFNLVENLGNVLSDTGVIKNYDAFSSEYEKFEAIEILETFYRKFGDYSEGIYLTNSKGIILIDSVEGSYKGVDVSDREYFVDASNGKTTWSEVLASKTTGESVSVYSIPIEKNGEFKGMLGLIVAFDKVTEVISENVIGKSGYSFMIDDTGLVISHRDKEKILKENIIKYGNKELEEIGKKMTAGEEGFGRYTINDSEKLLRYTPYKTWSIAVNLPEDEYLSSAISIGKIIIMIAVIAIILGIVFAYIISSKIVSPILKIKTSLEAAATGKLDVKVELNDNTEIGALGESVNEMIDAMVEQAEIITSIENGAFDKNVEMRSEYDIG